MIECERCHKMFEEKAFLAGAKTFQVLIGMFSNLCPSCIEELSQEEKCEDE